MLAFVLCYNSIDDVFAVGFEDTGSEKCSPAKSDNYHKFRPSLSYTCNQKLRTSCLNRLFSVSYNENGLFLSKEYGSSSDL